MLNPDELTLMTEREKLDLIVEMDDPRGWGEYFEPVLEKLIADESPRVRQAAIVVLWDLADPRFIEPLMDIAQSDKDDEVRGKAASVLGIYVYEAVTTGMLDEVQCIGLRRFLLDLAANTREPLIVRRMAIEALSFDSDDTVHDLIAWAYDQPSEEMRMTALFAMGRSGSPRWYDQIIEGLDSTEKRIKLEAINATAEAPVAAATPTLRNMARLPDRDVRAAALWALAHTRGPGALETIEMCALSDDPDLCRAAEDALEEYHASEAEEAIDDAGDYEDF